MDEHPAVVVLGLTYEIRQLSVASVCFQRKNVVNMTDFTGRAQDSIDRKRGLARYLSIPAADFQPSNVVWMIMDAPPKQKRMKKRERRELAARAALEALARWCESV